jgi:hypothetical protein
LALKEKIQLILCVKDTPHRTSIAFALGIFIGMSPLFGVHTILGFAVAYLFRLNKLVTLVGVYVTNPWTIIPIYTFSTWVGAKCLGIEKIFPDIDWSTLTFSTFIKDLGPLLMPFLVGTALVSTLSAIVSYAIIYHLIKKRNA